MRLNEYASAATVEAAWAETHVALARAAAEREARSGLVSVPTTGNRGLPPELVLSNLAAERGACIKASGAFALDREGRRLLSLRCAVGFAARAHAVSANGFRSDVPWMVTFTYRPGVDWKPSHAKEAIRHMRNWCKRKCHACRYVWIAEIQDGKRRADGVGRDVIHYHAVFWLPQGVRCPHFDSRGWWPHGMSQSKVSTHAVGYLMHYLKKDKDLTAMPKGARAYGVGGLDHSLRRARRWLRLPSFVQANSSILDDWRRAIGGGWIAPCGAYFASEFRCVLVAGVRCLERVATHARAIEAAGAFSWLSDRAASLALRGGAVA